MQGSTLCSYIFWFKKRSMSTFLDLIRFLLFEISSHTFENNLSDATDVAGIPRYFIATFAIVGYFVLVGHLFLVDLVRDSTFLIQNCNL